MAARIGDHGELHPTTDVEAPDVVDDIVATRALSVRVVDLPAWLAGEDLVDDRDARPDGVHWAPTAALDITRRFLGEQLVRAALGIE